MTMFGLQEAVVAPLVAAVTSEAASDDVEAMIAAKVRALRFASAPAALRDGRDDRGPAPPGQALPNPATAWPVYSSRPSVPARL